MSTQAATSAAEPSPALTQMSGSHYHFLERYPL